ncbi:MAG: DsrE family protein [bacterium]
MKSDRKIIDHASLFILFFIFILFLSTSLFAQILPWSWTAGEPLPIVDLEGIALSVFPPSNLFPTTGALPATGGNPIISTGCPIGLLTGLTLDEEFGPGASEITKCLTFKYNIKALVQINKFEARPGRPYALGNIASMINDYEITHGTGNYKIVAVVHDSGATLMLNRFAAIPNPLAVDNIYQDVVEDLIAKGVEFFLCQNSSRSRGIKVFQLIPGVKFVTSGGTALIDFQRMGFILFQP